MPNISQGSVATHVCDMLTEVVNDDKWLAAERRKYWGVRRHGTGKVCGVAPSHRGDPAVAPPEIFLTIYLSKSCILVRSGYESVTLACTSVPCNKISVTTCHGLLGEGQRYSLDSTSNIGAQLTP